MGSNSILNACEIRSNLPLLPLRVLMAFEILVLINITNKNISTVSSTELLG